MKKSPFLSLGLRLLTVSSTALLLVNCASKSGAPMAVAPSPPPVSGYMLETAPSSPGLTPEARKNKATASYRTGLATKAGREQFSVMNELAFYRKPAGQPDAVDAFNYNDEAGAKAMAEALGGSRRRSGTFAAAGNRLEVGLKAPYGGRHFERVEAAGRRIVIGQPGGDYAISLTNRTGHPVEVVASVDGLDVMTGKAASIKSRGYVIPAKGALQIDGWRVNREKVRGFEFGSVDDSAAATAGMARNVGVIGLAVYDEDEAQARLARLEEARKRGAATAFPGQTP